MKIQSSSLSTYRIWLSDVIIKLCSWNSIMRVAYTKTIFCLTLRLTIYNGKTTESVHCAITGPCLRMRHRPSARRLYRFGKFTSTNSTDTITRRQCCAVAWWRSPNILLRLTFCWNLFAARCRSGRLLFAVPTLAFSYDLALLFRQQFVWLLVLVDEKIKSVVRRNTKCHCRQQQSRTNSGYLSRSVGKLLFILAFFYMLYTKSTENKQTNINTRNGFWVSRALI